MKRLLPSPEIREAIKSNFGVVRHMCWYSRPTRKFGPGTSATDELYAVVTGHAEFTIDRRCHPMTARALVLIRRDQEYSVRPGRIFNGMHEIISIVFRGPKGWAPAIPETPIKLSPLWWRMLMSMEASSDYDSFGQRVLNVERIVNFIDNLSTASTLRRTRRTAREVISPRRPDTEAEWMEIWVKAEDVIRRRGAQGLSAKELAQSVDVSPATLRRVFLIARCKSPKQALSQWRIEAAQRLIFEGRLTISQIARRTGFSTVQQFSVAFKKFAGKPPSFYIVQR